MLNCAPRSAFHKHGQPRVNTCPFPVLQTGKIYSPPGFRGRINSWKYYRSGEKFIDWKSGVVVTRGKWAEHFSNLQLLILLNFYTSFQRRGKNKIK